jgi:hypothetical protein
MDTPHAPEGTSRRRLIDAAIGGGLALVLLITAAEASLPQIQTLTFPPRVSQPAPRRVAIRPPRPAPPVLIAFRDPIPGYPVISPFGLRQLPWEPCGRLHAGIDIAAPAGLPALAAADGVVTRVETDAGYGRFVELKHAAGLSTRYAHLGRFLPHITPGVAVKAGTAVGEIGSTGSSTGAHLHFEIRDDQDRPLNPELFLGRRFARAADLPLRAAQRIPRGVRVAYVSNIPRAEREAMRKREDDDDEAAAAGPARPTQLAANAAGRVFGGAASAPNLSFASGRPQARFTAHN